MGLILDRKISHEGSPVFSLLTKITTLQAVAENRTWVTTALTFPYIIPWGVRRYLINVKYAAVADS